MRCSHMWRAAWRAVPGRGSSWCGRPLQADCPAMLGPRRSGPVGATITAEPDKLRT